MPITRPSQRDQGDYDTSCLRASGHGRQLSRDYSAHFFRWSFARRLIQKTDHVLEVGCGVETPLTYILFHGVQPVAQSYTGVDLNKVRESKEKRVTLHGQFNFVKRWHELLAERDFVPFDVVVHLEVIEHMRTDLGAKFLKACWSLLKPGGTMLMSTPCYDGKRHAASHIHEYTVPELQKAVEKAGFAVEKRFGTFMDLRELKKQFDDPAVENVYERLSAYFDNDALSCFFAPLFPDHARNNLWVCRKEI